MYKEVKLHGNTKLYDEDGVELFLTDDQENLDRIQVVDANGKLRFFDISSKEELLKTNPKVNSNNQSYDLENQDFDDDYVYEEEELDEEEEGFYDEDGNVSLKTIMETEMDDDVKKFLLQSQHGINYSPSFWDFPYVKVSVIGLVIIIIYFLFFKN